MTLHAAIAWSLFASTRQPFWLLLGIVYASGKYLFLIQSLAGEQLEDARKKERTAVPELESGPLRRQRPSRLGHRFGSLLKKAFRLAGHADVPPGISGLFWPRRAGSTWLWPAMRSISPSVRWPADCARGRPMPEPRISVLIVARNEAANLAECLASARFADERVVVVDAASRDETLEIARRHADVVTLRPFDNFASQRNAALGLGSGDWVLSIDADERVTPELAGEIRRRLAHARLDCVGFRVPIKSEVLGRPFRYSGTQEDNPLRLFRRDRGRWTGQVHETVDIEGPIGQMRGVLTHRTLSNVQVFLGKIDLYTTLEAGDLYASGRRFRFPDLAFRPAWTFLKLYLYKQGFRDGLEGLMFCALGAIGRGARVEAARAGPGKGGIMTTTYEAEVTRRFDALSRRFKHSVDDDDYRLRGLLEALGPVEGRLILDLGCGKGRFARRSADGERGSSGSIFRPPCSPKRAGPCACWRRHGDFRFTTASSTRSSRSRCGSTWKAGRSRRYSRKHAASSSRVGSWPSSTRTPVHCRRTGPGFPAPGSSGSTSTAACGCTRPAGRFGNAGSGPPG